MAATRYSDLCRLCATKTNLVPGINIFENEAATRQIYKKIESCLPVQIHEGDELPKMICENCVCKLELLFDFRERTIRTESLLIDLFKELSTLHLQIDHPMKHVDTSYLDHPDIAMVSQNDLLQDHNINHVNDLDLPHLTHRDNMIIEHEIILPHHSVPLENIELSSHELNQELSNHSMQGQDIISDERFGNGIEYQSHPILSEQYDMSAIHLNEDELHIDENKEEQNIQMSHAAEENSHIEVSTSIKDEKNQLKLLNEPKENFLLNSDSTSDLSNNGSSMSNLLNNPDKDWFYCSFCGKSFEDSNLFDTHYQEHTGNKSEIYLSEFETVARVNAQKPQVAGSEDLQNVKLKATEGEEDADQLDLDYPDDEEVQGEGEPQADKKRKWSPKECKVCGKSYKTNYKLTEHMRKHTGEQPFKCKSCDKAFRSKIGLAQHEAKHTGHYDYACSTCGKGFQCKSYLMVHQRVHSDEKPYPCTTCGRNFKTKQSLLDHTNRHLGVKPYTCETCGRSFITNGLCKAHQKVHSGTDNRKYSCKVCNKMFVSKSYLQTHLRIHTGEKPFMCEVCGKGFLTRVDLRIHSTMHTGEKSYVCEMCGKAFARRDALRCHRRSHTGERPYSCDICGQTFTQFSPMAIHRRLHTGERPYECDKCGKKFVSKSTLMVHTKKHVT